MKLNELFEARELVEYGYRGFGGYGRAFFAQAHYQALVNAINSDTDLTPVKPVFLEWLCKTLSRDNPKFKEQLFRKAVEDGRYYRRANPARFQMRHFYYLAECIKTTIMSDSMREFTCVWFADYFDRYGGAEKFNRQFWFKYCDIADPDARPRD